MPCARRRCWPHQTAPRSAGRRYLTEMVTVENGRPTETASRKFPNANPYPYRQPSCGLLRQTFGSFQPRGCVICRAIRYPACCTAVQYSGTPVYSSMGLHRTAQAVGKRVILCLHRQPLDGLDRAARDACWREEPVVQCLAAGQRALDIGRPQEDRVLGVAAPARTASLC